MSKKSVGLKGGDHGLEHPEPKRGSRANAKHVAGKAKASAKPAKASAKPAKASAKPEKAAAKPTKASAKPGAPHGNRVTKGKNTAPRNAKTNEAGMTKALENSATGKPSRKSTRGSNNHAKENQLEKRQQRRLHSPEARAARGA